MNVPLILRISENGLPIGWETWENMVTLDVKGAVVWSAGSDVFTARGGIARSGEQSTVTVNSITATEGEHREVFKKYNTTPPVSRNAIYQRDQYMCLYCGEVKKYKELTWDHIVPKYHGGGHSWTNLATACKGCNNRKDNKMLSETDMSLLALPYIPNRAEFLILCNRRILADQMEFLLGQVGKNSRLRNN